MSNISKKRYRLVTRSDIDGLVCAVLLKHLDMVNEIYFVHPKDMQDGIIEIGKNDITANLPYVDGVGVAFDHHLSEITRNKKIEKNHIILPDAPSSAEVIYQYYGGESKFPKRFIPLMEAANKADAAKFTKEGILNPKGWDLLSFVMDSRTGLGRFKNFRISNYTLMMNLVDACNEYTINEIISMPDVEERIELYFKYEDKFISQLKRCSTLYDNVIVLDLRGEKIIYPGNRFMIYVLYPQANVSIHHIWGVQKKNTVFAVGKSIINKSLKVDIGDLMLNYNGGGHVSAGTCQVSHQQAEAVLFDIIDSLKDKQECIASV